jgi:catechol 2,3-dioxygenase-like lactoylglutathione lyase family enzyme
VADYPALLHTVLDTTDPRGLAEFYREYLGLRYRPGDAEPEGGDVAQPDWLVLVADDGSRRLAFQLVDSLEPTTWPSPAVPMQLHLDLTVTDLDALHRHRERAVELGAKLLLDRTDIVEEPLFVLADPAGHPFCIFVA